MLCDICGINKASVHLTEIINDQVLKMHLCEKCAKEKAEETESNFGLSDLLGGLADIGSFVSPKPTKVQVLRCKNCHMTYQDFKKIGKLGCDNCYDVFQTYLMPLLKRIHGVDQHVSSDYIQFKKSTHTEDKEIQQLRLELHKMIKSENFEKAAEIRDKIKGIEKKPKKS